MEISLYSATYALEFNNETEFTLPTTEKGLKEEFASYFSITFFVFPRISFSLFIEQYSMLTFSPMPAKGYIFKFSYIGLWS